MRLVRPLDIGGQRVHVPGAAADDDDGSAHSFARDSASGWATLPASTKDYLAQAYLNGPGRGYKKATSPAALVKEVDRRLPDEVLLDTDTIKASLATRPACCRPTRFTPPE